MKALQFKELTIIGRKVCDLTLAQDRQAEDTNECKPQLHHRSHADNYLCAARNTWPDLRSPNLEKKERGGAWNYQQNTSNCDCRCRFRINVQAQ